MKVKFDTSEVQQSRWYQYALRFLFGGTVTAMTGLVAKHFGPELGGLFLAFPAILPATATLIEKSEKEKKERAGKNGIVRGRRAAGVDAAGAAMGAVGLLIFAVIVWQKLPQSSLWIVLSGATMAWLLTAVSVWLVREWLWRSWKRKIAALRRSPVSLLGDRSSIHKRRS